MNGFASHLSMCLLHIQRSMFPLNFTTYRLNSSTLFSPSLWVSFLILWICLFLFWKTSTSYFDLQHQDWLQHYSHGLINSSICSVMPITDNVPVYICQYKYFSDCDLFTILLSCFTPASISADLPSQLFLLQVDSNATWELIYCNSPNTFPLFLLLDRWTIKQSRHPLK